MADGNAALKLYAHDLNTNTWYTLKPENYPGNGGAYIFRQDVINNTEYDISLENDMIQTNKPTLHNYNLENGINYGTDIKTLGYIYPETKHPLAVGDSRSITYKASPKSSIEWIFDLDFISWGNGWGIKVDSLETTGVNNYFVSTYNQQDITFTKIFEDEGYEDLREDTEVYLYGDEVKKDTIILNTSTNKNKNEWQGVFKNVPIYDSNWKKIEYRIEEKKSNNYTAYYDTQEYNGLVVKFSADTQTEDVSGQDEINIYYVDGENKLVRIPHY